MRGYEQTYTAFAHHTLKKSIALAPCGFFEPFAVRLCRRGNIRVPDMDRYAVPLCGAGTEFRVPLRLGSAYHVVEVRTFDCGARVHQHIKQSRRVGAARKRQQDALTLFHSGELPRRNKARGKLCTRGALSANAVIGHVRQ